MHKIVLLRVALWNEDDRLRRAVAIRIDVLFTDHALTPKSRPGHTVIVIDVLRATSTIATALHNGARGMYPVAEVEDARALARQMPDALLGGEREGVPCEGFHAGNSPLEYTPDQVHGRNVIITTTNGTRALNKALRSGAGVVGTGALLHAEAVATWSLQQQRDITLVCAGTDGHFGLEDALGAGCIVGHCMQQYKALQLSDSAQASYLMWRHYAGTPSEGIHASRHGQRLMDIGFARDVAYCAQVNTLHSAVVLQGDCLVLQAI